MQLRLGIIGIATIFSCSVYATVTISNVSSTQREGSKLVDIHYDVSSDTTNLVDVAVRLSDGATDVAAYSFSGDIGENISTGTGKLIIWDAGVDQSNIAATVQVHLIIDDGASAPNVYVPPCPIAQTGQTNSYVKGDDGYLQKGVASPEPRFVWQYNPQGEVLVDYLTGLMWEWVITMEGYWNDQRHWGHTSTNFSSALMQCSSSSHGGFTDWRLPTEKEILTLLDLSADSDNAVVNSAIRSRIDYMYPLASSITNPFSTNQFYRVEWGNVSSADKSEGGGFIAVRTMQPSAPAPVPASGQTIMYSPGDAGDIQSGTPWPAPRFIDQGETVTDRLTGLEWVKDPSLFGKMTWSSAVTYCEGLVFDGRDDWRLPNVNEQESLINRSRFSPALSADHPFENVPNSLFWTSSSLNNHDIHAYSVSLNNGLIQANYYEDPQTNPHHTWPVRGGE